MKYKTTKTSIEHAYPIIISAPYCALQNLLAYETPTAYTAGKYGWNYDVYDMGVCVAICTGYRGMPGKKSKHYRDYDNRAQHIRFDTTLTPYEKRKKLNLLCKEYIETETKG